MPAARGGGPRGYARSLRRSGTLTKITSPLASSRSAFNLVEFVSEDTMRKPTENQLLALIAYANAHGRTWKSQLGRAWETGVYDRCVDCASLQQVRNQFGPTWLVRFRLPKPEHAVDTWNKNHPVGTSVILLRDNGDKLRTQTRSSAWVLSGHTAVIMVNGVSGCYMLSRVSPILDPF